MRKRMGLAAILIAAVILSGCAEELVVAPELQEPVGVQSDTATAFIGDIYDIAHYDASVKPYVEEMYFEVSGQVAVVNAYAGKWVEEGDVLIELDQTSLVEQAESIREEIEYAERNNAYSDAMSEIDIDILEIELQQMLANHADKHEIALKENEIEQKKAALRQAQALREPDLQAKREQLEEISVSLNKNVLRAPFSGRVIYGKQLTQGSWVTAYDPVVYLADDSRLKVVGEFIPESTLKGVNRLYARIGAYDYEIEPLPIDQEDYISRVLSGETMTTEYAITGPEEHMDKLEAGQYAGVCVVSGLREGVLLVPGGAVLRDAGGRYVYVDEDGERVRRVVKVGRTTDSLIQITEGLEEGEVVYVKD